MEALKLAAIDLGTVSSRLLCATVRDGVVVDARKHTVITDLGEGVDASGVFATTAVERVVSACRVFIDEAQSYGASCVCTTLTSAARDVSNGEELLRPLCELGLIPQVISGEIEARLTFYGVAHDFPGHRIAVADSGGGSTEIVIGSYAGDGGFDLTRSESLNIGCRRVTERFFESLPPSQAEIDAAVSWMRPQLEAYWADVEVQPDRLIAVGGTVTSLVAMVHELRVYDSQFVHLRDLTLAEVERAIRTMSLLGVEGIAALPGIQAKRAPVIFAGSLVIRELMRAGGYERLTVSENSLLAGAAATVYEAMTSEAVPAIGWRPDVSSI